MTVPNLQTLLLIKILIAFLLISPTSMASEFCAIDNFGNKSECFDTLNACRQWIAASGGACVYSDARNSVKAESKPPAFVGKSKWCTHSPDVGFLKNTAICAYDTKSECSEKLVSRGEVCLLNPKFDSDPVEVRSPPPVATASNTNQSNWIFYFGDDRADVYLDRDSIFRYGSNVDVRIATNFKNSSGMKSIAIDMTIDCDKRQHAIRRALGTTGLYGGGSMFRDLKEIVDNNREMSATDLKKGSSMSELYARVCTSLQ